MRSDSVATIRRSLLESSPIEVFLGLGSNVGDRQGHIDQALTQLDTENQIRIDSISSIIKTSPIGWTDQPQFLNGVVKIDTALSPFDLLKTIKRIEIQVGRKKRRRWGPREIDLDILIYGDLVLDHPQLTIPHPEMIHRRFVLEPFSEIQPDFVHPTQSRTIRQLLLQLPEEAVLLTKPPIQTKVDTD